MRIAHISTNEFSGGAARAAYRLNKGLQRLHQDSFLFTRVRKHVNPDTTSYHPPSGLVSRLHILARKAYLRLTGPSPGGWKETPYDVFSDDRSEYGEYVLRQLPAADLYNLHWISGFIPLLHFMHQVRHPVVWTLHDMNAFTGGCHYDAGCGKFINRCGCCPQLFSDSVRDWSRHIWKRKNKAYHSRSPSDLHIVAPSKWMAAEVLRSSLLGNFPVSVIPYGVNTDLFHPRETSDIRAALNIPEEAHVILFVAADTSIHRKGIRRLYEALQGIQDSSQPTYLLSVGRGTPPSSLSLPQRHLGHVTNELFLSLLYSMADVFVIPSQQDNLPNTVLEAMACGTPVIGFEVGGIPDMVRSGTTGLLAPAGDVRSLQNAISRSLEDTSRRAAWGRACREVATREYTLVRQAERYLSLYQSLLMHYEHRNN